MLVENVENQVYFQDIPHKMLPNTQRQGQDEK